VRERALRNAVRVFCRNLRRPEKANSCGAGKHFAVIDQEGNIFPCEPFMQSPLASIRDKAFRWGDLWESPRMKSFDREITKNKCQCNWFCSPCILCHNSHLRASRIHQTDRRCKTIRI
jgi:radical SAM protein with 4Fe4S-binding SPASM domain